MTLTQRAIEALSEYNIPAHMRGAIIRYLNNGISPGDFLTAVINNDLSEAVGRADDQNIHLLPNYIKWFYNHAPSGSWGRASATKDWYERLASDAKIAKQANGGNHG